MSPFKTIAVWLGRLLVATQTRDIDPDALSLHDWADLPPHHPRS
jgi:hypothetical protein